MKRVEANWVTLFVEEGRIEPKSQLSRSDDEVSTLDSLGE